MRTTGTRIRTFGYAYDLAGNQISDGTNPTVWARTGWMLSHDGHGYACDGEERRPALTTGDIPGRRWRSKSTHRCMRCG